MRYILSFVSVALLALGSCTTHQNQSGGLSKTGTADSSNSWALIPFNKIDSVNPILNPGTGKFTDPVSGKQVLWEEKDVFNPAIVNKDGKVYMLYRAQDKAGTSRVGLA